jgi:hypothetical protein
MQRWEYLHVRTFQYEFDTTAYCVNVNGQGLKDREPLHAFLNQLGMEGWEMIGATVASELGDSHYLFFKRPRP